MAQNIILGDGVFSINGAPIALTRGGGNFSVEREYREIEADGDYGPVKGRIRKIRSRATLTLNALSLVPSNLTDLYPALSGTTTITATADIATADYQNSVTWAGTTESGSTVVIEIENAINLGGISWDLVDKEEVVPEIVYTATYDPDARTTEPWNIVFADTAFDVTFFVFAAVTGAPINDALIVVDGDITLRTNADGKAVLYNKAAAAYDYTVDKALYTQIDTSVTVVDTDLVELVEMTLIA